VADTDLWVLLEAVRDACKTLLGAAAPERVYVSVGDPGYEGNDFLIVWADQWGYWPIQGTGGMAEPLAMSLAGLARIPIRITFGRLAIGNVAAEGQPYIPDLEAAAQRSYTDAWILWNGLQRYFDPDDPTVSLPGVTSLGDPAATMSTVLPKIEQGLVFIQEIVFLATLEGYNPLGGTP
jgi:hypothetical protein